MKKVILLTCFIFLGINVIWSQGFTISGNQLRDANGNNFIMKGMNVPLSWYVSDVNNSIASIRNNTGSNCVRIVVNLSTPDASWQTCVQNCINNKMIPMVELHDATCVDAASSLNQCAQFWASKASYLTQSGIARYILINIANEWGSWSIANSNQVAWSNAYKTAITTIRNAGINTTIVIDAPGCGQDIRNGETLRNYASGLQTYDPRHNLLFSVHMYCEWATGASSTVSTGLPSIKNAGIPIIVGEFGYQHDNGSGGLCDIPESTILSTCQSNGIGWLAWSQKGNGSPVQYLDLSSDWAMTSLSSWGNTVINGSNGTKTSVVASVFNTTNVPVTGVTMSPTLASITVNGTRQLTATVVPSNATNKNVTWTTNNSTVAIVSSTGLVTGRIAGSATITVTTQDGGRTANCAVTVTGGGCTPTAIVPYLQVNNGTWTQTSTATVASGTKIVFGPQPVSGGSWSWSGLGTSGTSREQTIYPTASGTATATYTNASGCNSTQAFNITVSGGSTNKTITIRARGNNGTETMQLLINDVVVTTWNNVSTTLSNYTYANYSNGGTIKVAFTNDATGRDLFVDYITVNTTTYQTETTATRTGCGDTQWLWCNGNFNFGANKSATEEFVLNPDNTSEIKIYPNPAQSGNFTIEGNVIAGNNLEIYDLQGKLVFNMKLNSNVEIINSGLTSGLYILKVNGTSQKLIVE